MTKKELIDKVMEKNPGMSLRDAEEVVNTLFDQIAAALADADRVEIRGFGSFTVKERKAREARNPRTGEMVQVKARKVPAFKPGKELKDKVDG